MIVLFFCIVLGTLCIWFFPLGTFVSIIVGVGTLAILGIKRNNEAEPIKTEYEECLNSKPKR